MISCGSLTEHDHIQIEICYHTRIQSYSDRNLLHTLFASIVLTIGLELMYMYISTVLTDQIAKNF